MPHASRPIIAERIIDLSEPVEPVPWIIPGFAARGYLTILAGPAGVGKSQLALQLAAASGTRWAPSLYFDIENGPDHLRRLAASMNLPADSVEPVDMHGLTLTDAATVAQLTREVLGRGIATMARHGTMGVPLVVLDSLRRFAPGLSENSSDDMAPYLSALATFARATNTAVVLIHHASTKPDAPAMRGSSAIQDQADIVYTLRHHGDALKLSCAKCRPAPEPEPVYYRRQSDPLRLEPTSSAASRTKTDALVDRLAALDLNTPHKLSDIGAMLDLDVTQEADSRLLRRALDRLVTDGTWQKVQRGTYAPLPS